MKRLTRILSATIGLITAGSLIAAPAYAASASMSLSPASGSVAIGSSLSVGVYENSGSEPVNAVKAVLSYPAGQLQYQSIASSSNFSIEAESSGGGGTVTIGRGALPAVSGSKLVATVRFKALTSSGSAAISIGGDSSVVSANSNENILTAPSGGNYSLTVVPPAAPAAPVAPVDKIAPVITNVSVGGITAGSAVVSWTTSEPANSTVDFGLNTSYGLVSAGDALVTDHHVAVESPLLVQGTKYHFVVKSSDAAGNAATGTDQVFTTLGGTLRITVVNKSAKAISGAKVSLGDQSGTTDKNGHLTLTNFPEGKVTGSVTYKGKQTVVSANINHVIGNGGTQTATFKINANPSISIIWIILLILLILLIGGTLWMIKQGKDLQGILKGFFGRFKKPGGGDDLKISKPSPSAAAIEPSVIQPTKPVDKK